jgi:hypothetical protein
MVIERFGLSIAMMEYHGVPDLSSEMVGQGHEFCG